MRYRAQSKMFLNMKNPFLKIFVFLTIFIGCFLFVNLDFAFAGCIDSDHGKNYCEYGVCASGPGWIMLPHPDSCSGNNLQEYYCDGGTCQSETYNCEDKGIEWGCRDGACASVCRDSDGGKNYYESGICEMEGVMGPFPPDSCSGSNLREYYCAGGTCQSEIYNCADENMWCRDGACASVCRDSDGGKNYYERGICEMEGLIGPPPADSCSGGNLKEYYCGGGTCQSEIYNCADENMVCRDGVCVPAPDESIPIIIHYDRARKIDSPDGGGDLICGSGEVACGAENLHYRTDAIDMLWCCPIEGTNVNYGQKRKIDSPKRGGDLICGSGEVACGAQNLGSTGEILDMLWCCPLERGTVDYGQKRKIDGTKQGESFFCDQNKGEVVCGAQNLNSSGEILDMLWCCPILEATGSGSPPFDPGQEQEGTICDMDFTDAGGETHSPSDWCGSGGQSYDFCVGSLHYHFGCKNQWWGASNCDKDDAWKEECPGGCVNWECKADSGCKDGECRLSGSGNGNGNGGENGEGTLFKLENPLKAESITELIEILINFVFFLGIAIAPIVFLFGGFTFLTGAGNPQKVEKGKQIMLYTAVGLMVVLLSKALVELIKGILSV